MLTKINGTESGEVIILGSGPSKRNLPETNMPVIGLNYEIRNVNQTIGDYWLATDGGVIDELSPILSKSPVKIVSRKRLIHAYNIEGYGFTPVNLCNLDSVTLTDNQLFTGTTVAASAIQLACKLGFDTVYLYGIDLSPDWSASRPIEKILKHLHAVLDWCKAQRPEFTVIQTNQDSLFQPNSPCGENDK